MKYIVVSLNAEEQIFTFPRSIDHDRMMEAIGAAKVGRGANWERPYRPSTAIAAGFIDNGVCHGKSESLKLASRGAVDTALLQLAPAARAPKSSATADQAPAANPKTGP